LRETVVHALREESVRGLQTDSHSVGLRLAQENGADLAA
jgi:hypothetical protein